MTANFHVESSKHFNISCSPNSSCRQHLSNNNCLELKIIGTVLHARLCTLA